MTCREALKVVVGFLVLYAVVYYLLVVAASCVLETGVWCPW